MRPILAPTSNSDAFLCAVQALKNRGAREACWLLVTGEPGHGKSTFVQRYAVDEGGIYCRAKAHWTPAVALHDLVTETGQVPEMRPRKNFDLLLRSLATSPRPIVIDEVEHALDDRKVLETVRDLSDLVQVPVIIVGMDEVDRRLKRFAQVYSRVNQIVRFRALDRENTARVVRELCEVEISDDVIEEVQRQTAGFLREMMDAIATIEAIGRRQGTRVTGQMLNKISLIGGRTPRVGGR